jgi:hypothetical protein
VHACNFPDRVASDGTPVRTYDAFLSYLELKDTRIRRSTLPIGGRNTVLWMDPQVCVCVRARCCVCAPGVGGSGGGGWSHQAPTNAPLLIQWRTSTPSLIWRFFVVTSKYRPIYRDVPLPQWGVFVLALLTLIVSSSSSTADSPLCSQMVPHSSNEGYLRDRFRCRQ